MPEVVQVIGNVAVGGAERHLLDLVEGLGREGVDIRVVCPRPGPLAAALMQRGLEVHFLEMVQPRPGDEYGLDWPVVEQLARWFGEWRPDVVHSHLYPAHLHASLAAAQTGVQAIVQTAHTLVVRPGDVLLGRLTPTVTIATSHAVGDLQVGAGVPRESIEVIYNGVGPEHFRLDPEAVERARAELELAKGPLIGTIARLSHEKGIDQLLRAFSALLGVVPDATAVIVGDGPDAPALRQLARELGIAQRVRFLGVRTDVPTLNGLFDVFVLPSREEACPMALLEAMAAGRAVAATRVGGSPELVTDGVDGVLVAPEDSAALADALVRLLADPSACQALGAAARKNVAASFTRERMLAATVACYRRLLAGPPLAERTVSRSSRA